MNLQSQEDEKKFETLGLFWIKYYFKSSFRENSIFMSKIC